MTDLGCYDTRNCN